MTQQTPEQIALERIQQAERDGSSVLDLRRLGLTSLPPGIANLTGLTELNLVVNQLTSLPPEIENLTGLTALELSDNELTSLPPEISNLTSLTRLDLSINQLTSLPPEIGNLASLTRLDLSINQFTSLPPEIGNLASLTRLDLSINQFTSLPPEIGNLTGLTYLDLDGNKFTSLPREIENLISLTHLYLDRNQLTSLPPELANLTSLSELELSRNPLTSPDPGVLAQGTEAVLAFLRQQLKGGRRQWVSKLLVVGEGGVGKTSLLGSLRGETLDEDEETTHGVQIVPVELAHPDEAAVVMRLNAWDFGGQVIYHATHQFFLTDRSLFVIVGDARQGYERGRLNYWLETIGARAPESPVLIVAAHIDERDADLPRADLRRQYPQIEGFFAVSNRDGRGVQELRERIAELAAGLPLMGQEWPASWLDAVEDIRALEENSISPSRMLESMAAHGIGDRDAEILGQILHDLGDIIYFRDDAELNDTVILKPQWVSKHISDVLESEEVVERNGVFTRTHMDELWSGVDTGIRGHFLRLMERFDLSYRTLQDRDISLVVERLPLDPAAYATPWESALTEPASREISLRFQLSSIPAGVPTWFIARSHRFTTNTHWRSGALFSDRAEREHLALVRSFQYERYIELAVRGPTPQNFFALLKDGVEVILERFPGLDIRRLMPCPGHNGNACEHFFGYDQLLARIELTPPRLTIECPVAIKDVSVTEMLYGLAVVTQDAVLQRIESSQNELLQETRGLAAAERARHAELLQETQQLTKLIQRQFADTFKREQSQVDSACPNVFVLAPSRARSWRPGFLDRRMNLVLYCSAPGEWHPTKKGGRYTVDQPAEWLAKTAPHISRLVSVMKYTAPILGPWLGVTAPGFQETFKSQLDLMQQLVEQLPSVEDGAERRVRGAENGSDEGERAVGAGLRALRQLLDDKDPNRQWGGLRRVLTPEHHYLWLCDYHAKEYD